MIEQAPGYRLGYVQFDDAGHYAQPGQLEHVLADIGGAADQGLILVAFTHGWKQNADAGGWSVRAFRTMLADIAERERALAADHSREPRQVAGVFLGWPGRVAALPGFNGLTWFDREDAAERIARGDYGNALLRLKQLRDSAASQGPPAGSPGNQLLLVGHSLGATMLYQRLALEPLRSPGVVLTPIADLVLLLSPAIPATDASALERLSATDRSLLPPIIAITSSSDATLRTAYPLAQWLDRPAGTDGTGEPAGFQAMGVYAPLITHRLDWRDATFTLTPTRAQTGASALLQIAASPAVMRGHKDIANPRLVDFIADVAALQLDNRLSRAALASAFPAGAQTP
jgi:hypothetical protein